MKTPTGTLFVVDDESYLRKAIAVLASSMEIECEAFSSAEEFLSQFDPARGGCLLVDLRLKGMSGLRLQELLVARGNTLPVILLSAFLDVPTAVRAMRNGALTVLAKPCHAEELTGAIRTALEIDSRRRQARAERMEVQQRIDGLIPRERRVMEMVVAGETNKAIAGKLEVSQRTVDRLRAAVFRKMGAESAVALAQVVATARASGEAKRPALRLDPNHSKIDEDAAQAHARREVVPHFRIDCRASASQHAAVGETAPP